MRRADAPGPVLLLDGGDLVACARGSPGAPSRDSLAAAFLFEAMGALGYRATGLGERDLCLGEERLRALSRASGVEILCANVRDAASGLLLGRPHRVVRLGAREVLGLPLGGVAVGVTSVLSAEAPEGPLAVEDPVLAARSAVRALRRRADVVVVIAHTGIERAREIAREVAGIDLLLVAHEDSVPREVEFVGSTLLLHPVDRGRAVAVADIALDGGRGAARARGSLVVLNESIADDPAVAALVERYRAAQRPR